MLRIVWTCCSIWKSFTVVKSLWKRTQARFTCQTRRDLRPRSLPPPPNHKGANLPAEAITFVYGVSQKYGHAWLNILLHFALVVLHKVYIKQSYLNYRKCNTNCSTTWSNLYYSKGNSKCKICKSHEVTNIHQKPAVLSINPCYCLHCVKTYKWRV